MRVLQTIGAILLLLALATSPAVGQDLLTQYQPGEIFVGPVPFPQTVRGVPVEVRASTFLRLQPDSEPPQVLVRIVADLSDLQRNIGTLIDTIPLPTDNCARYAVDNLVPRIWGKQITIDGDVATLRLNGDLDVWQCFKNPIPCTDEPIKHKINQPFDAQITFHLAVSPPDTVVLGLGDPQLQLGGVLGSVTNAVLKIVGVDIKGLVKEALERAIDPAMLKTTLPEEILRLNPTLTRASFLANGGSLAATLELKAPFSLEALGSLVEAFSKVSSRKP